MKRAFLCLFVALAVLAGHARARDIKTVGGDVFKNITVQWKDATGIQVMHDDGVAFLDFKNLSAADQKEFGYNAATYADGWKQKFEAEKKRREAAELAAQQAKARADALAQGANGTGQDVSTQGTQTGIDVGIDSPNINFGGWVIPGFAIPGVVPNGPIRNGVPYNGTYWGPVEIRRR
ncbi:MAG TPA: hypothetical protein VGM54_21130 [Chthoniobacter sp.]|jgi:hypothetical protein